MTRINATLNNTHKRLQSGLPSLRPPPLRPAREAFKHMYPFVSAYKLKRFKRRRNLQAARPRHNTSHSTCSQYIHLVKTHACNCASARKNYVRLFL